MPLGSAAKSTIDIDFTRAQGVNSSGRIIFKPVRQRIGTTIISDCAVVADIVDGVGSIDLVRLPVGVYRVTEFIDGKSMYNFSFVLPLSADPLIQYEDIARVDPAPVYFTSVRSVNGLLPNPVTGDVAVTAGGSVPDASTTVKGKIKLAGDLSGTADAPTVPALDDKYVKPVGGIPLPDFSSAVQALLAKADTAIQPSDLDVYALSSAVAIALAGKETAGAASAAVTAHIAASNPHPNYALSSILSDVATDGQYSSLTGLPTIPDSPEDIGAQPAGDYVTNVSLLAKFSFPPCKIDGFVAWTGDPLQWTAPSAVGDGNTAWVRLPIAAGEPLTKLWVAVAVPGIYSESSGKPNRLAIADDTATVLSLTPIDNALYTVEGWRQGTLISPIAAESSPRWVYIGLIVGDMTGLQLRYPTTASTFTGTSETTTLNGGPDTHRRGMYVNGLSVLPSSFDPTAYGTVTSFMPLVAVS